MVLAQSDAGAPESSPHLLERLQAAAASTHDATVSSTSTKPKGAIGHEYARQALLNGMRLQGLLGTNPFRIGLLSGTDTHTGLTTGSEESNCWGKFPAGEPSAKRRAEVYKKEERYLRKDWTLGAAGITGVWATANTRAAIWDAMKRLEVYASSGPRIAVRFFAGWDFADADADGDLAAAGYAKGVPMGGDLTPATAGKAPTFLLAAMKDPDGGNLDRVQVVKGWVDSAGKTHEKVYGVLWSGEREPGADGMLRAVGKTVDMKTAKYSNDIGEAELKGVFKDPEFDPAQRAFYYARAIEIPTPRWTLYDAVMYKVKMSKDVSMTLQERAITSPIWYEPKG